MCVCGFVCEWMWCPLVFEVLSCEHFACVCELLCLCVCVCVCVCVPVIECVLCLCLSF